MQTSTFSAKKSSIVPFEQLASFETPVGTSTWQPVPHVELASAIRDLSTKDYGLTLTREQYAVGSQGRALFGVLDFDSPFRKERGLSLAYRHSNDKRLPVKLVGGTRVFICDNLALTGEVIAVRKHTRGLHLFSVLRQALDRFLGSAEQFEADIIEAEGHTIEDEEAKVRLFDLRYKGILPSSIADEAARGYFEAERLGFADSQPRTLWGLHNACTRPVKALAPSSQQSVLVNLARAFGFGAAQSSS